MPGRFADPAGQLWPEHLTCPSTSKTEAAAPGTFGARRSDDRHPLPYLYVTHWVPVADDPYWNDTVFGGRQLSGTPTILGLKGPAAAVALEFPGPRVGPVSGRLTATDAGVVVDSAVSAMTAQS